MSGAILPLPLLAYLTYILCISVNIQGNLFLVNCPVLQKKLRMNLRKMHLSWKVCEAQTVCYLTNYVIPDKQIENQYLFT